MNIGDLGTTSSGVAVVTSIAHPPNTEKRAASTIASGFSGEPASLGSRLHPDSCNPCIFWFKDKAGHGINGIWVNLVDGDWNMTFIFP